MPTSILAENLIGRVATELQAQIDDLYPDSLGENPRGKKSDVEKQLPRGFAAEARPILSEASGFIQAIRPRAPGHARHAGRHGPAQAIREDGLAGAKNDRDKHDIEIVYNRVLAALQGDR